MFFTAWGTLGSRVLGLVRDQLITFFFGGGMVASALLFALQIPNLFRRLLGEGALTAAVVPVMTDEHKRAGRPAAFRFLNQVLLRAALFMAALTLVAVLAAWGVSQLGFIEERYRLSAYLITLCMPYMPLVCLAAMFTAALNVLGRFGVTSLSAVWLNISMIGSLCAGGFFFVGGDLVQIAVWACIGAILGGVAQLLIPAWALWREGWRPRWAPEHSPALQQLQVVFLPALAGAGIQQINFFVSRFLALNVDDRSLTVYYLANRIVELPIGLFAITVATVIFPALAMHAARGERVEMGANFAHGMRLIFAINIPAAAGLIALDAPIVHLLFEHGKFTAADTQATLPVLWIFAVAMPFYGAIALMGRALNAIKETQVQAKLAGWVFLLNIVLSPLLAWFYQAPGLAVANLVAAVFQCARLYSLLKKNGVEFVQEPLLKPLVQCLGVSLLMGVFAWGAWRFCGTPAAVWLAEHGTGKFGEGLVLGGIIVFAALLCFALLALLRYPEYAFLREKILRRK
jgi:putative peptidoglycan lipid II flippase